MSIGSEVVEPADAANPAHQSMGMVDSGNQDEMDRSELSTVNTNRLQQIFHDQVTRQETINSAVSTKTKTMGNEAETVRASVAQGSPIEVRPFLPAYL